MLDFDNNEVFESFEDEFRKKKRKVRNGGQFPSWVALVLLLTAGAAFFFYKNQTQTLPQPDVTPSVMISETAEGTLEMAIAADATAENADPLLETASPEAAGSSGTAESKLPGTESPVIDTIQPIAGLSSTAPGSADNVPEEPIAVSDVPLVSTAEQSAAEPLNQPHQEDTIPVEPTLISTTELPAEPAKASVVETPNVTQNLNFFQRIVYSINPNWVVLPTAAPETPSATQAIETLAIDPLASETTALPGTLPADETQASEPTTAALESESVSPASAEPLSETTAPVQSEAVTALVPEQSGTKVSVATVVMPQISSSDEQIPSLTLNPIEAIQTLEPEAAFEKTVIASEIGATIIAPQILNQPTKAGQPSLIPSADATLTEVIPTVTASPTLPPEPTQALNFFQRAYYFVFPGNDPRNTETPVPTDTAPTAAATEIAAEPVEPAELAEPFTPTPESEKSLNIFQRFVTYIFPKNEPTATVVPAEPTITAQPEAVPTSDPVQISDPQLPAEPSENQPIDPIEAPLLPEIEPSGIAESAQEQLEPTTIPTAAPTLEPTSQPNIFQRFVTFIFPRSEPTVTPMPTVIVPSATAIVLPEATQTAPIGVTLPTASEVFQPVIDANEPTLIPSLTAFVPQRDDSPVQAGESPVPTTALDSGAKNPAASEPTVSDLDDEPLKFEDETVTPESTANAISLNPRLTQFVNTQTPGETGIDETEGPNAGTAVPIYQPTQLPDTGFADQWNIPMMILVVMVLLAMILGVRFLRTKR